ncbi:MAG TPA: shikimate kinase [Tepidisphaeraceae bacterium]|nr:shikimate kinase [Tepidisphaeraceae bacterium]
MRIVLIGYRGSGKTTVGRKLADRAGVELIDTDEIVVRRAGKSIREIFESDGEVAFRDLESSVLEDAARWLENRVLSTGGGIVLRESNRNLLRLAGNIRIYLEADAQTLFARIHADPSTNESRPALTALGGSVEEVRSMLEKRDPLYREVSTHVLDARLDSDELVESILKLTK